ncbi:MAG: PDDEXK nuclease domain-containing protein [Cytophagales bacterium]|nr:PDDEXK nuclease domain-containing protein [Cytophagales bacterium]
MKPERNYIAEIRGIITDARTKAYAAVNFAMVEAYWLVGKRIVEQEQQGEKRAAYGEKVVKELSVALTAEFGKGFSIANLKNFRQFYLAFPEDQKSYALRSQLTWTHYRLIMRVEDPKARAYYIHECAEQQWSSRVLERNINTFYYQRLLSSQQNPALPDEKQTVLDFIKDPYVFEFLDITPAWPQLEKDLETALLSNLQQFLLELGKGFTFLGRQFRISTETEHFFIDLVFYNYLLKCFVLIDLKTGKLTHQDVGQMDMYRRMFDDLKKPEGDNPTIGILLCTEKSETVVKYSVISDSAHLFATKYKPYLPTEAELIAEIEREKLWLAQRMEEKAKNEKQEP